MQPGEFDVKVSLSDRTYRRREDIPRLGTTPAFLNLCDRYSSKWLSDHRDIHTLHADFSVITYSTRYDTRWYRYMRYICPETTLILSVEVSSYYICPSTGDNLWCPVDIDIPFRLEIVNKYKTHNQFEFKPTIVDWFIIVCMNTIVYFRW